MIGYFFNVQESDMTVKKTLALFLTKALNIPCSKKLKSKQDEV